MAADGTFPRSEPAEGLVGPGSNTGQKGREGLSVPMIDWLSATFPAGLLQKLDVACHEALLLKIFGWFGAVAMSGIRDRPFQFYRRSAVLIDACGNVCGQVGIGDAGEFHVSLSGQGCKHVGQWDLVAEMIERCEAKITRVDIAVDDFAGNEINIERFKAWALEGVFNGNGRPPKCKFVDDFDSGDGKTLYIGKRGYRQLCIYDKGQQLGDPGSAYCRAELRLYSKHHHIGADVLREPGKYFAGAYEVLEQFIGGEIAQLEVIEKQAEPCAKAMVRALEQQCGAIVQTLHRAFGPDLVPFLVEKVMREGVPGRFKRYTGDVHALIRKEFQDPGGADRGPPPDTD
jgi:phage replication initiation protein